MKTHAQKYQEVERWRFDLLNKLELEQGLSYTPLPAPPEPDHRAAARILARSIRRDKHKRAYDDYCARQARIREQRRAA